MKSPIKPKYSDREKLNASFFDCELTNLDREDSVSYLFIWVIHEIV